MLWKICGEFSKEKLVDQDLEGIGLSADWASLKQ
jgi:hypothetical protein